MYIRHQILLENWLSDYIQTLADQGSLNFSEIIRLAVCLHLCRSLKQRKGKDYRLQFNEAELTKLIYNPPNKDNAYKKKLLSDLYFEARKNLESSQLKSKH